MAGVCLEGLVFHVKTYGEAKVGKSFVTVGPKACKVGKKRCYLRNGAYKTYTPRLIVFPGSGALCSGHAQFFGAGQPCVEGCQKSPKGEKYFDKLLDSSVLTTPEAIADAHMRQAKVLGKVHGPALKRPPVEGLGTCTK